jgi:hypothetical protein
VWSAWPSLETTPTTASQTIQPAQTEVERCLRARTPSGSVSGNCVLESHLSHDIVRDQSMAREVSIARIVANSTVLSELVRESPRLLRATDQHQAQHNNCQRN